MAYYKELNKTTWKVLVGFLAFLSFPKVRGTPRHQTFSSPEAADIAIDYKENWNKTKIQDALEMGSNDNTSMVHVSTMIYFTREFKDAVTDPIIYVEKLVEESNKVFENSEVPLRLQVYCIQELDIGENQDPEKRGKEFRFAMTKPSARYAEANEWTREEFMLAQEPLLNSADTAILMTATAANCGKTGGAASLGPSQITGVPPTAWATVGATWGSGVEMFTHEVGHLFGCLHNRETMVGDLSNDTGYGYLVNGTKYRTTMAYPTDSNIWIPYFSSKDLTYEGVPIGDADNDNRAKLIQNRFLVSQVGDESGTCSTTVNTCAGMCLRSSNPKLTIHDREIWCRDYCKMPATGYYNLNGQAVGIEQLNTIYCTNASPALTLLFLISLTFCLVIWVTITLVIITKKCSSRSPGQV